LSVATIFASAFGLIWELNPGAFVNLVAPVGGDAISFSESPRLIKGGIVLLDTDSGAMLRVIALQ
jgi:hypothetical protein